MFREIIVPFNNETIHNHFFSQRIDTSVNNIQFQIDAFYKKYLKNVFVLVALNVTFLIVSFVSGFIISIRTAGIIIAFIILLAIISRALYVIFGYTKQIIIHRKWIANFIRLFIKSHSIQMALKNILKQAWENQYSIMTNTFMIKLHSVFAKIGLLKPVEEIVDEVIEKHYQIIRKYLIGNIMYKIVSIFLIFAVYSLILQPLLIHLALKMEVIDIMAYPIRLLFRMNRYF